MGGGLRYAFRGDNSTAKPTASLVAAELLVDGAWRPLLEVQGPITLLTTDYIAKGEHRLSSVVWQSAQGTSGNACRPPRSPPPQLPPPPPLPLPSPAGGDFYNFTGGSSLLFDSSRPLDEMMAAVWRTISPVAYPLDGRVADCAKTPDAPLCAGRYGTAPTLPPWQAARAAPAPAPAPAKGSRKLLRQ